MDEYNVFETKELEYLPLCDDFGPYNISCVTRFVEILEEEIDSSPQKKQVYLVERSQIAFTNGAFLLGAFMMLKLGIELRKVIQHFKCMDSVLLPYRDATYGTADFGLSVQDCWAGLAQAMDLGWLECPTKAGMWGKVRICEYNHYENPLNADLVQVVPGKFIAFKGPVDLGSNTEYKDLKCFRKFSPEYYSKIFKHLLVSTVIQLNERHYNPEVFRSHGIHHVDLQFPDCTAPPAHIVSAFLREVEAAPGLIAVHCKAGLGRTGTLIAVHLMLAHGFSAPAAIAWLRIMRPGSVIGEQQAFLCHMQPQVQSFRRDQLVAVGGHAGGELLLTNRVILPLWDLGVLQHAERDGPATLAAQVSAACDRRTAVRALAATTSSQTTPRARSSPHITVPKLVKSPASSPMLLAWVGTPLNTNSISIRCVLPPNHPEPNTSNCRAVAALTAVHSAPVARLSAPPEVAFGGILRLPGPAGPAGQGPARQLEPSARPLTAETDLSTAGQRAAADEGCFKFASLLPKHRGGKLRPSKPLVTEGAAIAAASPALSYSRLPPADAPASRDGEVEGRLDGSDAAIGEAWTPLRGNGVAMAVGEMGLLRGATVVGRLRDAVAAVRTGGAAGRLLRPVRAALRRAKLME